MARIRVTREELAKTLSVWLAVVGIEDPWILRDLSTRRGEPKDKRDLARRALADHLAHKFDESKHDVTREDSGTEGLFG